MVPQGVNAGVCAVKALADYEIVCNDSDHACWIGFWKMKYRPIFLLTILFTAQGSAVADGWDWGITPYLWAAGIDGGVTVGPIDADVSVDFKDLVDVLQGGALLRLEGNSGQNGIFADLVYLALEEDEAKDTIGGTLAADLDALIVEAGSAAFREKFFRLDGWVHWRPTP